MLLDNGEASDLQSNCWKNDTLSCKEIYTYFFSCAQCHCNRICWRFRNPSMTRTQEGKMVLPPDTMSLYTLPTTRAVLVAILLWFALLFTLPLPSYTLLLLVPTCFNHVPLKTFLKRKRKTKLRVHLPKKVLSPEFTLLMKIPIRLDIVTKWCTWWSPSLSARS